MKTLSRIALVLAVAFWTFAGCEEHARADADQCLRALAPAAEDVRIAGEAVDAACWGPHTVAKCAVAESWLEAAQDRHAAALALCPAPVAREYVEPFAEPEVDPFEPTTSGWAAVTLIPVPGVPYLVDPLVEQECPGLLCPIVVITPAH